MTKLPDPIRKRLASEFRFAAKRMAESPDLPTKLYFFSAFYGEIHRMLNQAWGSELSLVHLVLKATYDQINGRIMAPTPQGVNIPVELPDALDRLADEIAAIYSSKEINNTQLFHALGRASALAHVVSGNGYYLYLKGEAKISGGPNVLPPPSSQSRTGASPKASRRVKPRP